MGLKSTNSVITYTYSQYAPCMGLKRIVEGVEEF